MSNPLDTWLGLNEVIVHATEETCKELLKQEMGGKKRTRFLLRIHSRLNRVRADRERRELTSQAIDRSRTARA